MEHIPPGYLAMRTYAEEVLSLQVIQEKAGGGVTKTT